MKKIKVLIVAGSMNVGGIENQLMHLIRYADNNMYQIDFTTTVEHPFYQEEIEKLGGHCIHLPACEGFYYPAYCKTLYRILKTGKYDVVHSNELFHSGIVLTVAKLAGVKCRIAHAHSCNQNYGNNIIRLIYNRIMRKLIRINATQYLACSSIAATFLYGKDVLQNEKYHLIVNSVETSNFLSDKKEDKYLDQLFSGWRNILQVGRFSDEKNYLFTAQLAEECKRRNNGIRFICVGNNGNDYEKLVREKIQQLDIENYMILLGVRKDVPELMKRADALILPSKYEGMPLTLIEAQAACLPCVVADTFSHEVDFGTESITWLELNGSDPVWTNAIETAIVNGKIDQEAVKIAICNGGFDAKDFARKLCACYMLPDYMKT